MGKFLLVKVQITLKLSNVGSSNFVNGGHNKICKVHLGPTSHHPQSHTTKVSPPCVILIKAYIHFTNGRIQGTLKWSPHYKTQILECKIIFHIFSVHLNNKWVIFNICTFFIGKKMLIQRVKSHSLTTCCLCCWGDQPTFEILRIYLCY
jgi:hypothetical protein